MSTGPQRGRLGAQLRSVLANADYSPKERHACTVSASLSEDGTLTLQVTGAAQYLEDVGSRVAAVIEQHEIPETLQSHVAQALRAVLNEAHEDLKAELDREVRFAIEHAERIGLPEPADDGEE